MSNFKENVHPEPEPILMWETHEDVFRRLSYVTFLLDVMEEDWYGMKEDFNISEWSPTNFTSEERMRAPEKVVRSYRSGQGVPKRFSPGVDEILEVQIIVDFEWASHTFMPEGSQMSWVRRIFHYPSIH